MAEVLAVPDSILQMFEPKGVGKDPPSTSLKTCTLTVFGTDEVMTVPVYTNTKVLDVKTLVATRLGIDTTQMKFVMKQTGRIYRENKDCEEVARQVTIRGIPSFKRQKHVYDRPHAVIGAGHIGLKAAITWLSESPPYTNFVIFDRRPEVGGTSWWDQANISSRLQTEVGVYHLEYHEDNGWPPDCRTNPWPSRNQLIARFKATCEDFGVMPYCRMSTEVTNINVIGKDVATNHYEMTLENGGKQSIFESASVALFPGNLTNPKRVIYRGEELFDGPIVYGISSAFDYASCGGKQVAIIGSGAFAVENVRTCTEYHAQKIFMICRRKSLSMPRCVSWLCNQSISYITAALTLEAMSPMYDLIGVDQWAYYAVNSNAARTFVTIKQAARFGIGDVYFLCMYYGYVEHIVDDTKRVSGDKIHLISGRVLENISAILKLLGFQGEFENDKLMKCKELFGWWVNKDPKRMIVAEPIFVDANNFGGTSFSPGALQWCDTLTYFLHYPKDWWPLLEAGALPTHAADPEKDRPAYVVEARHGSMTGAMIGTMCPGLAEIERKHGALSHKRMWQMHPVDTFISAAKKEWDEWSKIVQSRGYTKPHPEYPYTEEIMRGYLKKEWAAFG